MKTLDEMIKELPVERQDAIQRKAQELIEQEKKNTSPAPGSFAYHEAMDRAYLMAEMVYDYLCNHSVILNNIPLKALAATAHDALLELYNTTSKAHFDAR